MNPQRLSELQKYVPKVPLYYTQVVFSDYTPWNVCWEFLQRIEAVIGGEVQCDEESGAWANVRIDSHDLEAEIARIGRRDVPSVLALVEEYRAILESFAANEGSIELVNPNVGLFDIGLEEMMSLDVNYYERDDDDD